LSKRNFSNWLLEYMSYTKHSESPDSLHFWTGVSTIAGALRRKVWIDQRHFQWTPNFYIVFVAPPGIATKSTTIGIGMKLLREVKDVCFGPNSMTWQGLTVALEESKKVYPKDELGSEFIQMSCLTIPVSELGTFLKPKETDLIDLLVDLWDGGDRIWKHRIKTGDKPSTEIVNPWMNVIGCTTPAWMRGNFPSYMIEGGLTSRCVFVFGDRKRQLVAYPADLIVSSEYIAHGQRLAEDLIMMSEMLGEYELTIEAKEWGRTWYAEHWKQGKAAVASDRYSGYLARKQTHMHKLAIVLAAAQRQELIITLQDLETAHKIVTALEVDMERVFKAVGASDDSRNMNEILAVVRAAGTIPAGHLWRAVMNVVDKKDFDIALQGLISAKLIIAIKYGDVLNYSVNQLSVEG
jgi:hypothetical protein